MRRSILLTLLLVLITTVGVRAEVVPIQKPSVGTHAVTTNQQETILQLQEENKKLKEQLERTEMDKEIQRCRDYVDRKANDINDNLSHWLVILSIVIGSIVSILGIGLGIVAPYILNRRMNSKVDLATEQAKEALEQAKAAAEQAKKAEDAAKAAKVSQLFTEAFNEKDSSRAIELYTQLLALNPDNAMAYYNRGVVKDDLGDKSGALSDYDKAISLNPDYAEAYNNRGNVKDDLGDKSGALSDYDKSIELNPDYAKAYNNRAVCYRKMAEEEKDEEKKKEYLALAKADEKKYKELTGGKKK